MGKRNLWHLCFAKLLRDYGPSNFEIQTEIPLSVEPQEADVLLLRREGEEHPERPARTLLRLWPLLSQHTILEFKSPSRDFRQSDLIRLYGYGPQYHALCLKSVGQASRLSMVLVVPGMNQALQNELELMGFRYTALGEGYGRIDGTTYPMYLVCTNEVSEAERDDFLRIFSHRPIQNRATRFWWEVFAKGETGMSSAISEMDGFEEMARKFVAMLSPAMRLEGLAPKERLLDLPHEERLLALDPMDRMLAIPDELLPYLPEGYIQSLPLDVQHALRARIAKLCAPIKTP